MQNIISVFDDGISSQRENKINAMSTACSAWGKIKQNAKIWRMRFGTTSWDDICLPPRWHGGLWSSQPTAWSLVSSCKKCICQVMQFQFVLKIVV